MNTATFFQSVLVVCVGNICRSPVGERALSARLRAGGSTIAVTSAGLAALVGNGADAVTMSVAAARGISLDGHVARQFSHQIGLSHDLILVMEQEHLRDIVRRAPDLSGRVMLFDRWTGAAGISDPYRRPQDCHERAVDQICSAASAWASKLLHGGRG